MKLPYKITEAANRLYSAGVSYHAFGTLKIGKSAYFDYYKTDKITLLCIACGLVFAGLCLAFILRATN